MIYGKIYLDDENIIFDSVKKYVINFCYPAGEYVDENGKHIHNEDTTISQTSKVAISHEAKDTLKKMLSFRNEKLMVSKVNGELQLIYNQMAREGERGIIVFKPDSGKTSKTINSKGEVRVCSQNGFSLNALSDMKILDNEFLKSLDLTEPFDEKKIKSSGEEPQGKVF